MLPILSPIFFVPAIILILFSIILPPIYLSCAQSPRNIFLKNSGRYRTDWFQHPFASPQNRLIVRPAAFAPAFQSQAFSFSADSKILAYHLFCFGVPFFPLLFYAGNLLYLSVTSSPVATSNTCRISIMSAEALPFVPQGSLTWASFGILIKASIALFG